MRTDLIKTDSMPISFAGKEKYAQAIKEVFLLLMLRSRNIPVEKTGFTEPDKEKTFAFRILPPNFTWSTKSKLQASEYAWLRLVLTLLKEGFDQQAILRFKSFFFSSHVPFMEKEEDKLQSAAFQLTYLECIVFYIAKTGRDVTVFFSKDGELSFSPTLYEEESDRKDWIGIPLSQIIENSTPDKIQPDRRLLAKVDQAEIELLKATRNESVRKLTLQKPDKGAVYKWDLSTIEQGTGTASEIHTLTQQAFSKYGEFKITGNGQNNRIPFMRTIRTRYK